MIRWVRVAVSGSASASAAARTVTSWAVAQVVPVNVRDAAAPGVGVACVARVTSGLVLRTASRTPSVPTCESRTTV